MKYSDFKLMRQKTFDSFLEKYAFFAFSGEQLKEGLAKFSQEIEQGDKVLNLGGGFFLLKSKFDEFENLQASKEKQLLELMTSDYEFAVSAFQYEASNHEYMINYQGDYDVVSCFGSIEYGYNKTAKDYLIEAGFTAEMINPYKEAIRRHAKEAEENGWY